MSEEDIQTLINDLYSCLKETESLEIDHTANRWLGEAQAVAADIAHRDASDKVIQKRIGQIKDLLKHVDDTGNPEADKLVEESLSLVEEIEDRL